MKDPYTPIPNKIFDFLLKSKLSGTEMVLILAICRQTYGWQKGESLITNTRFKNMTGLPLSYVIRRLKKLRTEKVFTKFKGDRDSNNHYYLNENVLEWKVRKRSSHLLVTSNQVDNFNNDHEVTKDRDLQVTQEINKENKERTERIKAEIREKLNKKGGEENN